MGPIEALNLALDKEIKSIEMYEELSKEAKLAKDIFQFLIGEEQKHKRLIEQKIQELSR
ncbi:MAG: ferritin family protein [Candidatus Omnitrophota bacterium]